MANALEKGPSAENVRGDIATPDKAARTAALFMTRLAEAADRYEDMLPQIRLIISNVPQNDDLTLEERNLLSIAFQNYTATRRSARRMLTFVEARHTERANGADAIAAAVNASHDAKGVEDNKPVSSAPTASHIARTHLHHAQMTKAYRAKIDAETEKMCSEVQQLLHERLIPRAQTVEAKVFYYKMQADYYRYLAELAKATPESTPEGSTVSGVNYPSLSLAAYEAAYQQALLLLATHPVRLGLILNYSVFQYDIMSNPRAAWELAKQGFDDAVADMDTLSEDNYASALVVVRLLRDNLELWNTENEGSGKQD